MLSGVGPSQQLKDHSIDIIRDLPGVGAHLMDHVVIDGMPPPEISMAFLFTLTISNVPR